MIELRLDTNDTDLMGSSSLMVNLKEVISKYHLTVNNYKLKKKAYESCLEQEICNEIINTTNSEIIRTLIDRENLIISD